MINAFLHSFFFALNNDSRWPPEEQVSGLFFIDSFVPKHLPQRDVRLGLSERGNRTNQELGTRVRETAGAMRNNINLEKGYLIAPSQPFKSLQRIVSGVGQEEDTITKEQR